MFTLFLGSANILYFRCPCIISGSNPKMSSFMEDVRRNVRLFTLTFITTPMLCLYVIIGRYIYPPFEEKMKTLVESSMRTQKFSDEYGDRSKERFLNFQFVWSFTRTSRMEIIRRTKVGHKAPNETIVSPDGKTYKRILDLQRKDRPLVLNFGSCT